jgi:transposase
VAVSAGAADNAQKKSLHAAEQDRPDVAEKRRAFIRRQPSLDPDHLVFIDETWAATNMARRYGRAARGLRLLAPVPHGHWKVTTLVAGLRRSGITAPCVFDGAINGERFRAYVEQMLAPRLRPDDIVLLDNLSSHKIAGVEDAITAQGARLIYLPPYAIKPLHRGELFSALCVHRHRQIRACVEALMHLSVTGAAKRYAVACLELRLGEKGLGADVVRG